MTVHVMIDLETLGTRPGCVILSIGAAVFNAAGLDGQFYVEIAQPTCRNAGLSVDQATLGWWMTQSEGAQAILVRTRTLSFAEGAPKTLLDALVDFSDWFETLAEKGEATLAWGNGADFDLPILSEAYHRAGGRAPWKPYNGRCYRTLKNMRPGIKLASPEPGRAHNALYDAQIQAQHAVALMDNLGMWDH